MGRYKKRQQQADMRDYLNRQVQGQRNMSQQQKQTELQMERKMIHDTVERMKNREVNRE